MTAITAHFATDVVVPRFRATAPARTRLRLTVRGRRVLAGVIALPLAVAIGFGTLAGGSALASRQGGVPADSFTTVTVSTGQTLWGIATSVAPAADPRDVVDAIMQLNALDTATLLPGQRLAIPAEYAG